MLESSDPVRIMPFVKSQKQNRKNPKLFRFVDEGPANKVYELFSLNLSLTHLHLQLPFTRKLNLKEDLPSSKCSRNSKTEETAHHCASEDCTDANNNEISLKRHTLLRNLAPNALISKSPVKAVVRRPKFSKKTVFKTIKNIIELASSTPNKRVIKDKYFDSSLSPIIFDKSQHNDNKIPIEQNRTEKSPTDVVPNEEILEQRHLSQMDISAIATKTTTTAKDMHIDIVDNSGNNTEMVLEDEKISTKIYHKTIGSISKISRPSGSISSDSSIVQKQNSISNEPNSERTKNTSNALTATNEHQIELGISNLRNQSQRHNMKDIDSPPCEILAATRSKTYLQKKAIISSRNNTHENIQTDIRKEKPNVNVRGNIVPCHKESGTNASKNINGNLNISADRTGRAKRKTFPNSNHPIKKEYYNPFNRNDNVRKYK